MNHFRAKRLLPQLLDGTLPASVEGAVRAHTEACISCATALDEFELCEELLGRLPATLVPSEPSAAAEGRLRSLARWAADPEPSRAERVGVTALGTAVACAMLALVFSGQGWLPPEPRDHAATTTLAAVMPDHQLLPGRGLHR